MELIDLILSLEAESIFDSENFTQEKKDSYQYLKEYSKIKTLYTIPKEKKVACVTGHRPKKEGMPSRYRYDYNTTAYTELKVLLKQQLVKDGITDAWTGMAQGTDMCFAFAVLELRNIGYPIQLHCAIPFKNHSSTLIYGTALEDYNNVIRQADDVKLLSQEEYKAYLFQKRNEYMVDQSELVYAVSMDVTKTSGTKNCVEYAKTKEKSIIYIDPDKLEVKR